MLTGYQLLALNDLCDDSVCSICKQELNATERYISKCNHVFHYNCIHQHKLTLSAKCPLCRDEIKLDTHYGPDTTSNKSFIHVVLGIDNNNFYVTTGILYQVVVIPFAWFNCVSLFLTLYALIRNQYQTETLFYMCFSLILGTIQSLINIRIRVVLDENQTDSERFAKKEVTIVQISWFLIYFAILIWSCYILNNVELFHNKKNYNYLCVLIASNICRLSISFLKMLIYWFEIYEIYERALNRKDLYAFLTFHS